MKHIKSINEFYNTCKIYYRGVGEEEAIESLKKGHLIYQSNDPMSQDWEVIKMSLGSEAYDMSEEEIDNYVNEIVYWEDISKGVNLTTDKDNAMGYQQLI